MEELNQKRIDRAVLVGLNADCFPKEETATETTLDELEALLNTAGGECAGKILQNKHTPDPRSFIGEGKAEEVRQLVLSTGANMVIFDNDLTPSQTRTLEDILKTTVLDRSALILDIFAQRAKTREGKLQVELAQYQYYLPRLTVWNEEMGRLGGGIGTRGPGETQLETDKRYIRSRIQKLRENLEDVRKVRAEQRRRRQKNDLPVVALVGYTNAGKSTLLNRLVKEDKAIVSDIHGTTRDVIEDTVVLQGITFRFIDTAGIRETHDAIENMGIERTFQKLDQAHIVIWLIDATGSTQDIEKIAGRVLPHCTDKRLIVAFNKIDKIGSATQQQLTDLYKRLTREKPNTSFIFLSASHDQNIDVLEKQLTDTIQSTQTGENDIIVTNARHYEALLNAHDAILRTLNGLQSGLSGDFLAQDIRECMHYLGEITGQISTDEILGTIFSKFCIGK